MKSFRLTFLKILQNNSVVSFNYEFQEVLCEIIVIIINLDGLSKKKNMKEGSYSFMFR